MPVTVGDLVVRLRANVKQFATAMQGAAKRMKTVGASMSNVGAKMTMGISAPLGLIGLKAVQASMQFETSFAHIRGLVGASEETINKFKDAIGRIGPVAGKTGSELAKATFFITSAGLKGDRAAAGIMALEAAAKGAAAGLGDTATVADAATSAMNAYGEANLDAKQAVSILVATVREGKAEAASIAPVLGRLLPIAAELGVGFDQVGASLAAMTRLGFDAATSATSIRATMIGILKPASQSRKALQEYGLSFADLRAELREKGLLSVLQTLKRTFGENEEAMSKVFPNVRALAGVLSLVGANAEHTQVIFDSLAKTTGKDLDKAFAAVEVTARMKLDRSLAAISAALRQLGDNILPALLPWMDRLTAVVKTMSDWFAKMPGPVKQVVTILGMFAVVAGPLVIILGALVSSVGSLIGGFGVLAAKIAGTTAATTGYTTAVSGNIKMMKLHQGQALAMKLGLVALVGTLAYMAGSVMRPYLNKWLGINKAMDLVANKQKDLASALADSEPAYRAQMYTFQQLKKTLKLTGDEWQVQAEFTKENAHRLSRLTDEAIKYARNSEKKLVPALDETQEAAKRLQDRMDKVKDRIMKAKAANDAFIASVKEKYELQTKSDILASLKLINKEYLSMVETGYNQEQIQDALGEQLVDLAQLAKENGIQLEEGILKMAGALQEKADPALKKSLGLIANELPKHVNAMPGKIIPGMIRVGDKIAEHLAGGFDQGFKDGVAKSDLLKSALATQVEHGIKEGATAGEIVLGEMRDRQETEVMTIKVTGDWGEFDDQARYRSAGYTPETGAP